MKFVILASILCVFIAGCRKTPDRFAESEQCLKDARAIQERPFNIESGGLSRIEKKVPEYKDVDSFVAWLREQPGVADVEVNKKLLLTSSPPQAVVLFTINGIRKRLLLLVEPEVKLKLIGPELLR